MRHPTFPASVAIFALVTAPILTLLAPSAARAASFTVSSADAGFSAFAKDNDVSAPITFTTSLAQTSVVITSDSFANLGGFDLTFALFGDSGNPSSSPLLGQSSDVDFGTGLYDDVLSVIVPAGNYALYVTQYDNLAAGPNLSDGFLLTDSAFDNYTGGTFQDIDGNDHNGSWRVTVNTVAVPEADARALILPLLPITIALVVRRRRFAEGNHSNG